MAAAYEAFLQRIQDGLKKEEEEEEEKSLQEEKAKQEEEQKTLQEEKAKQEAPSKPFDEPPPLLEDEEEDEELPSIDPAPSLSPPVRESKSTGTTNLKELYEEICQQIRTHGTLEIIMRDFQEFKTDLDRVTYISQLTELEDLELGENYAKKNHDDACNYEKVYDLLIPNEASASKALDVMKKCIQKTPPEETSALAMRYMKRAWAFLLLEQFVNAAVDAKKSLSYGCPEENLWNSYEILGHANSQAKDFKQAEFYFLKALENLRKSNTINEVKATVTVRIMTVFKSIKSQKSKKSSGAKRNEADVDKLPHISYGAHKSFPSASSALDFVVSKERGRCVIAKRDIKPGDVLMVDSPYVSVLCPDFMATHCYNCFKRAPVPIPCSSCAKVCYCREECRVASWDSRHAKECRVLNHLIDPGIGKMAVIAFRVVSMLTWPRLQKLREKIDSVVEAELQETVSAELKAAAASQDESPGNPIQPLEWGGIYSPDDYMTVLLLCSNSSKRTFGDLFKRSITAVYLAKCLKVAGYFPGKDCSEEDLLFVASVILRHLQGGSCNAYEISEYELGPNGVVGSKLNEVGGAIYTTISMTNHACFCNTSRYSIGDKCVLRALRTIPKGSEVLDNYGFHYYVNTFNERQETLINQYKFKCNCIACSSMWSMYPHHPTETLIFRCPAPDCGQACCYSSSARTKCNMCGNEQQYSKFIKDVEGHLMRFKDAIAKLRQGNLREAVPVLCAHMEFLDCHVILPIKHYSDVQEAIKQSFNHLGNMHKWSEPVAEAKTQERSVKLKAGKNKFVNPNKQ